MVLIFLKIVIDSLDTYKIYNWVFTVLRFQKVQKLICIFSKNIDIFDFFFKKFKDLQMTNEWIH